MCVGVRKIERVRKKGSSSGRRDEMGRVQDRAIRRECVEKSDLGTWEKVQTVGQMPFRHSNLLVFFFFFKTSSVVWLAGTDACVNVCVWWPNEMCMCPCFLRYGLDGCYFHSLGRLLITVSMGFGRFEGACVVGLHKLIRHVHTYGYVH